MSTELQGAINVLAARVEQRAQELAEMKRMVNSLCREAGQEPLYSDADMAVKGFSGLVSLRSDQFYGKSPTVAAREYLDLRGTAVSLEEILEALQRGGFSFESQGWTDAARLRNLGISIGKNTAIFHRLPNDNWGLAKWYPDIKQKKPASPKANGKQEAATTEAANSANEAETKESKPEEGKTKTANAD